jgi:ElaB/YqjD/DUF883 family membrane-anchored ribosome-binding protein
MPGTRADEPRFAPAGVSKSVPALETIFLRRTIGMAKDTIQDLNSTTDYAADKGQTEIEELRRQVKDLTDKYGSIAQHTIRDMRDSVQRNVGDFEQQIREKPVQATLIAAGVGFLIGALLTR